MTVIDPPRQPAQRTPSQAAPQRSDVGSLPRRSARLVFAEKARPLRFAAVGGVCALLQLGLLFPLIRAGVDGLAANTAAYLLSAQLNFALSDRFIWHDRRSERRSTAVGKRWLCFHTSIASTFLLNEAVFIVARLVMPDLVAAAAGIGVAAIVNFIIQDALTFR